MNTEKWQQLKGNILDKFDVEEQGGEHLDDEGGVDIEFLVFQSPLGKIRLEHVRKPVILDKKTTYSNRIGSETKVDYVYAADDWQEQLIAYKWDKAADDWAEMDAQAFV